MSWIESGNARVMDKIGVTPHIVEAVLGHVNGSRGGVAGVYRRMIQSVGAARLDQDR